MGLPDTYQTPTNYSILVTFRKSYHLPIKQEHTADYVIQAVVFDLKVT